MSGVRGIPRSSPVISAAPTAVCHRTRCTRGVKHIPVSAGRGAPDTLTCFFDHRGPESHLGEADANPLGHQNK